ncbi:conserved oligomeric Golgi complex subunit 1 isoform 3-T4 [Macrochelys suwanniensis]
MAPSDAPPPAPSARKCRCPSRRWRRHPSDTSRVKGRSPLRGTDGGRPGSRPRWRRRGPGCRGARRRRRRCSRRTRRPSCARWSGGCGRASSRSGRSCGRWWGSATGTSSRRPTPSPRCASAPSACWGRCGACSAGRRGRGAPGGARGPSRCCTRRRSSIAPQHRSSCCLRFQRRSGVPWRPLSTYVPLSCTCSAAISTASCSWIPPAPVTVPSLHASPSLYDKWQQPATSGAGIKAQVCSLMELVTTTLYQAHALFYTLPEGAPSDPSLPCSLLFSMLETTTGPDPAGKGIKILKEEMKLSSWFKYLPLSVVEFQPTLRTLAHPISQDYLRDTLQKWINMCNEDIRSGLITLLGYVKSLKGLAGIRDAVWELLTGESMSQNWDTVCHRLLDKPISFWEDLLRQLFLDRLQTLTKEGFDFISSSSKQLLSVALQELEVKSSTSAPSKHIQFEHNMALFLWSESPSDMPSDAAWVNVANRSQFAKSGLSMKAQALTPCVQSFCSALDTKLKAKLDDLLSYLPPDSSTPKEILGVQSRNSAFDRYADAGTVEELLRDNCITCIQYVLGCVREELQSAEDKLKGRTDALNDAKLNAVLFMARLCQSLGELCPHLKQCILGKSGSTENVMRETRSSKKLGKGKAQEVNPTQAQWQEVKEQLLQQSLFAYQIWSSAVIKVLVHSFTKTLLLDAAGSILAAATNWDEIEIQEETETGSSVTSKIRLPVQPSWYVQCLLFSLCQEVNRVGGHALPKRTLQLLLKTCLAEVLAGYETLVEEKQEKKEGTFPMTQNRALQLLYDLRYLNIVLTAKSEEAKTSRSKQDSRIEKVTDFLEANIDPFDLDVFTPHLNSSLNRLVQRTSVLFGLLTGAENQYTNRSNNLSSQEPYNILPLASSQIRFGLLPLSMSSSRRTKSAVKNTENQTQVPPPSVIRAEEETFRPGSLFRQLATEEEDTAAPSLFKLGWLSSMTK